MEEVNKKFNINKKSKNLAKKNNNEDNFLTRSIKFTEKIHNKIKNLQEEKIKNEDKILNKNFKNLYQRKKLSEIQENYYEQKNWKENIEEISRLKKEEEMEFALKNCTFKPRINQNSKKIAEMRKSLDVFSNEFNYENIESNTIDRLYKFDVEKRNKKINILKNIYTPTFSPVVSHRSISRKRNEQSVNLGSTCYTLTHVDSNKFQSNKRRKLNLSETRDFSSHKRVYCNTNTSFSSEKGDLISYNFITENDDTGNMDNMLKEKFKDVFDKFK